MAFLQYFCEIPLRDTDIQSLEIYPGMDVREALTHVIRVVFIGLCNVAVLISTKKKLGTNNILMYIIVTLPIGLFCWFAVISGWFLDAVLMRYNWYRRH